MNRDRMNDRLLVEWPAQMTKTLLDQRKDTPATVIEAGAGVSKSGDVESTAGPSLLAERGLVKRQGVAQ